MDKLQNGDRFPSLTADRLDGTTMTLPDDLAGSWSLVLFYRGHW